VSRITLVYDTEKPAHERLTVTSKDGTEFKAGAFWLQFETTNLEKGRAIECINIKRWGPASERNETHRIVGESWRKAQEAKP
jgi:hypothetical protein